MSKLTIKPNMITLRPRRARDEEFLRMAYESSRDVETKDVLWPTPADREAFFRHQFDAQQKHFDNFYENLDYDIIESDGKPIGRLVLSWETDHLVCVDIIIIAKYRRQKIGSAIMEAITKEVDRRGISCSLMYEKWKPYLEKFYERYGFKTTKEYPTHFNMDRPRRPS
jgi:GNAT superfamily N-acetyltransferase